MTTKTTKATKMKAVKRVFSLVKDGTSITEARKIVAKEFEVIPNTLYNWQAAFGTKSPTITKTSTKTPLQVTDYSFTDMSADIRNVLKSIINQDGRYTTREAGVVGKLYGAELTRAKLLLEVHKHNTKVSSGSINNNILSLN
jgi:transposase-like protein|tara:strand:- start:75 stop:500 length:426 start_codon:yes stop_codon:yes gene_type:complete